MTPGYGISGIGYPMMGYGNYGLGNYGLNAGGTYSSYDNYMPSMMGMNSPYGYGMSGMMGMYNPTFMARMQADMEKLQLQHSGDMHSMMLDNQVRANRESNRAVIGKLLTDASVQHGVENLYDKVLEGDQDGICEEFDRLKQQIYHTYRDELKACGDEENPAVAANKIIEQLYSEIVRGKGGQTTGSLKEDIKHFGDSALANGFYKGLKPGHHERYVDETINHCFGTRIDERDKKEFAQTTGEIAGRTTQVVEKGLIGAGAGAGAYIAGLGFMKGTGACFGLFKNWHPLKAKYIGRAAVIAGLAGMAADIWWQISSNKAE